MSIVSRPIDDTVDEILSQMTLAEKIGQLNMPLHIPDEFMPEEFRPFLRMPKSIEEFERYTEGSFERGLGPGGGFFQLAALHCPEGPRQQAEVHNQLQDIASKSTRLKIPLLQIAEGTHGVIVQGTTIFPEGLTIGSAWDPRLVQEIYAAVAREARAVGIHALCTLVIEPVRDPRLGRNCEGYTEDPFLLSRIAEAIVVGTQGDDVSAPDKAIAILCHYPVQSEPTSGMERGSIEVSERTLRDTFLPSWEGGITKAGALGVMATYPAIDGIPAHGSDWLLTRLLREELGFEGIVVSEGLGFATLIDEGVVGTQKEAGAMSLDAGVDVNITYEDAFLEPLIENVNEGIVSEQLIDRAVRRVLLLKARLGLFEDPFVEPDRAVEVVHSADHQLLALDSAREGIVLLKNSGAFLPLDRSVATIAVIGPNAHDKVNQLGDYTIESYNPGSRDRMQSITTVLDGIRSHVDEKTVVAYAKGCDVVGSETSGFAEATRIAAAAEVAVVVVGERQGLTVSEDPDLRSTVGEGHDVASLDLTGVQEELIKAVVATGTPTVVVLINGRPLSVRWVAEHVPAIVEAWLPGERGGQAVADVLFGDHNPSGRLSITIPRHVGQLPCYYNHRRSKAHKIYTEGYRYVDMPATPLWEFGYGLSYTTFEYSGLRIDPEVIGVDGEVRVTCEVKNTGQRAGKEVVQLYVRDVVASVAPRDRQLRGFQKISLGPGESKTVEFTLGFEELKMLDRDMRWVVEPGTFEVLVGASSQDIRLTGSFEVKL